MAHPRRADFVEQLFEAIPEAEVVWDRSNDEWDTGRRSLLAFDRRSSHHIVIQDDAVPCRDLVTAVTQATRVADGHPIGLYMGEANTGPRAWRRARAVEMAKRDGIAWIETGGPWWGVGFVLPTRDIDELVEWGDQNPSFIFDRRIARFYELRGVTCWYTVPSLVDHRPITESPSLYPRRKTNRQAHDFIGAGASAVDIDWSAPPVAVAEPIQRRRRMARKQRIYQRDERGRATLVEVRRRIVAERSLTVDGPHGVPVRIREGKPVPLHLEEAYRQTATPQSPEPTKLADLKRPQLLKLAKARGIPAKGTNAELVEALSG